MNFRNVSAALAGALLLLAAHAAQAAPSDGFFYESRAITDHVTLIYRPDPVRIPAEGNVTVIEQRDGLVVVDAGGSPIGGTRIVQKIKSLNKKPVRFLIYTHYHGDHNLGAGAFMKAWPNITIISTEATRVNMTGAPMNYIKTYGKDYGQYADSIKRALADPATSQAERDRWTQLGQDLPLIQKAYANLKAWPARITFTDHITLNDEDAPVEVAFLGRANTGGDAVIWLPKQRVLCSGDIVVQPIPYASASYPTEWIAVLQKLKEYDFAILIPGHGAVQTDRAYLDKLIGALTEIRDYVTPLAKQGVPLDKVYEQFRTSDLREKLHKEFPSDEWEWRWMRGVFLGAIIGNAYKEAKGDPIVQGHDGG